MARHKEEVALLRKESMRVRTLETEVKNSNRLKEKLEEQMQSTLTTAKSKLEKEQANVLRLTETLKVTESRLKEVSSKSSKISEMEASLA